MIAGTDFYFESFERVWPMLAPRAQRWIRADVLCSVRALLDSDVAVCIANREGIVVMMLDPQDDGKMDLKVLLAVSTGEPGAFQRQQDAMVTIAKDIGARRLTFKTDRTGWGRMLGQEWSLQGETFSRSLT